MSRAGRTATSGLSRCPLSALGCRRGLSQRKTRGWERDSEIACAERARYDCASNPSQPCGADELIDIAQPFLPSTAISLLLFLGARSFSSRDFSNYPRREAHLVRRCHNCVGSDGNGGTPYCFQAFAAMGYIKYAADAAVHGGSTAHVAAIDIHYISRAPRLTLEPPLPPVARFS